MTRKFLKIFFIIGCVGICFSPEIKAQENFDPPEIRGSFVQEYQELKIEITRIQRVREYQSFFPKSDIPRSRKIIAAEGHEIAVVHIHTTRLGDKPGIRVYYLYLLDEEGNSYRSYFTTFSIGTRSESRFDPKEHDYEFPVQIPKDTKISAVQLHQPIRRETQPTTVIQKITFDVSQFTN